jgi:hypothetical protein
VGFDDRLEKKRQPEKSTQHPAQVLGWTACVFLITATQTPNIGLASTRLTPTTRGSLSFTIREIEGFEIADRKPIKQPSQ